MTPHPSLRFRYADPTFCHSCGGDTLPVKDTHSGQICTECRTECAACEDWMMNDSGLTHQGRLMHTQCALEAMEAAQDAVIVRPDLIHLGGAA